MEGFYDGPEATLAENSLAVAMKRGTSALDRSAAASGGLLSGAQAKAISDYAQGTNQQYMQTAYGDYTNRLAALAGIGQTAYSNQNAAGMGYGNAGATAYGNMGNAVATDYGNMGNAQADALASAGQYRAAGTQGTADAWGNAFNQIGRIFAPSGYGQSGNMPSWMSGSLSAQVDANGNPRS
jgi:hypothetical protein